MTSQYPIQRLSCLLIDAKTDTGSSDFVALLTKFADIDQSYFNDIGAIISLQLSQYQRSILVEYRQIHHMRSVVPEAGIKGGDM